MFDCVPTRIARNGACMTSAGRLIVKNAKYERDFPSNWVRNVTTRTVTIRAYTRHLFKTDETFGLRLTKVIITSY